MTWRKTDLDRIEIEVRGYGGEFLERCGWQELGEDVTNLSHPDTRCGSASGVSAESPEWKSRFGRSGPGRQFGRSGMERTCVGNP